jgi:hypothetical protein
MPIPVKIYWNLFSKRMFTMEVKKKKRAPQAAHFSYKRYVDDGGVLTLPMKAYMPTNIEMSW